MASIAVNCCQLTVNIYDFDGIVLTRFMHEVLSPLADHFPVRSAFISDEKNLAAWT
jgi:hypothetical protein